MRVRALRARERERERERERMPGVGNQAHSKSNMSQANQAARSDRVFAPFCYHVLSQPIPCKGGSDWTTLRAYSLVLQAWKSSSLAKGWVMGMCESLVSVPVPSCFSQSLSLCVSLILSFFFCFCLSFFCGKLEVPKRSKRDQATEGCRLEANVCVLGR